MTRVPVVHPMSIPLLTRLCAVGGVCITLAELGSGLGVHARRGRTRTGRAQPITPCCSGSDQRLQPIEKLGGGITLPGRISALDEKLVCFAHGKESGPWGTKIRVLAEIAQHRGFVVESIDFRACTGAEERVEKLVSSRPAASDKLVLTGSSMGAYVALSASRTLRPDGLFLMAPAVYLPGYETVGAPPDNARVRVVHGWHDDVVPVENAIRFARQYDAELFLVNAGHSLVEAVPLLAELFGGFLDGFEETTGETPG